jgi:2-polyprenyl-3-methyl-5-hydroxy-6-metoxy-1,4-benzoquinol methylase
MTTATQSAIGSLDQRARQSLGHSNVAIYAMVERAIARRHAGAGVLIDVGCGRARLWSLLRARFNRYIGVDAVRYDDVPAEGEFRAADLDAAPLSLLDGTGDVVAAIEVIEHLENPRALMRELVRLAKPGGWVVVTTPNQLSLLSLLTLVLKHRFSAFQDNTYPAHLTALLEVDLRRIAAECGLVDVELDYSGLGRAPLGAWHYPAWLSRRLPRAFSDNVLLIGRRAHG